MDFSKVLHAINVIGKGAWRVLTIVVLFVFAAWLILAAVGMLNWAMKKHWAWGFPVAAVYCIIIYFLVKAFQTGKVETWQGIFSIVLVLLATISVFSFSSFVLNRYGAAHFRGFSGTVVTPTSITGDFIGFYLWQLFELIPGLKINEAFGWKSPLENLGPVAGVLLIAFRVVIIFVLLKAFRDWWAKRGVEKNKELVRNWFSSVWNNGRAAAIDEMLGEDGSVYGLSDDGKSPLVGPVAFKVFHAKFREAFPGIVVTVEDVIAEGDKVVARCSVRGKHTGDRLGIAATQKSVEFAGIGIARIKDGKIVEAWNNFDFMTMHKQIDAA